MKKCQGFSIIEYMVYIAASVFCIVIITQFLYVYHRTLNVQQASALFAVSLYCGMDHVVQVCQSAPADSALWVLRDPTKIMWKTVSGCLGFQFRHSRLEQIVCALGPDGHMLKSVSSLLVNNIEGMFHVHSNDWGVTGIDCVATMSTGTKLMSITKKIGVRAGRVT